MMSPFDSQRFLKTVRERIESSLELFFKREVRSARHPFGKRLISAIREYTLRTGAKRTRGTLVVLGYLSNPRNRLNADVIKLAAAYELLHAYLLIHDDIIDQDVLRRGGPTLHKAFEKLAPLGMSTTEREKLGSDIAIIAGDITADLVQRCVLSTAFTLQQKVLALEIIERTLHTTYVGQVLDILAVPQKVPRLDEQILRYRQKTAIYTIEAPFMLGARLGKARINTKAFHGFALDAGVAFQLADDVQNVFSTGLAGRSSDIRHGKITLLISFALRTARTRKKLLALLARKNKTPRDLVGIRMLIIASGGYDRATALITKLYHKAEKRIPSLNLPPRIEESCKTILGNLRGLAKT